VHEQLARERAEVGALQVDDARIAPQPAEQLTVSGVDGVDAPRAGLE